MYLSRHCLPVLPGMSYSSAIFFAIMLHLFIWNSYRSIFRVRSSSGVQAFLSGITIYIITLHLLISYLKNCKDFPWKCWLLPRSPHPNSKPQLFNKFRKKNLKTPWPQPQPQPKTTPTNFNPTPDRKTPETTPQLYPNPTKPRIYKNINIDQPP